MQIRPTVSTALHTGWEFKARAPGVSLEKDVHSDAGWFRATVPGTVQLDLLEQGRLPDPYYGLNEQEAQWPSTLEWLYRLTFTPDPDVLTQPHTELQFGGLDTLCTVWLNGEQVLRSADMFVAQTVNVKGRLQSGTNTLHLLFGNVIEAGRALEAVHGKRTVWNGDSSRVYLRKAQYHYGWDWGPVLLTAGPWQPIRLRGYQAAIRSVHLPSEVAPDLKAAVIPVSIELEGDLQGIWLYAELHGPDGNLIEQLNAPAQVHTELHFDVGQPQLWWPNGLGKQAFYTVTVRLQDREQQLDECRSRIGLRRLRVLQEPVEGEAGRSFTFEINNVEVFIGGANWIPGDLLLNRMTPERYRERLTQARDAQLNMIRVWGGGIYEQDVFYDLCDELGLLVWQDFMFACGLYPAYPEFLDTVRQEAEQQVKRLRNHPALAIWAGNNEDYAVAESLGISGPGIGKEGHEAHVIYEEVLAGVVNDLDPQRLYWPGSPWGGETSADPTIGDRHSWEVWHGPMARYQDYHRYQARFVSEFGMQSAPALRTLEENLPESERYPGSLTMVHHNKAADPDGRPDGHRRMAVYLADNLRGYRTLAEYVYQTQFIQGEAMRYAYRDFRRRFGEPGRRGVSGAIMWQLNDCWPGSSWAIIDSSGQVKPAYHTIRREMSALTVGISRTVSGLEVWLCSAHTEVQRAELSLFAYTLNGHVVAEHQRQVRASPGRTTPLDDWQEIPPVARGDVVYFAALSVNGSVVSRSADFPEPYRHHAYGDNGLQAELLGPGTLRLSARAPTKGVWLDAGPHVAWSDNFIDLRPGEARVVPFTGALNLPVMLQALDTEPITLSDRNPPEKPRELT